MNYLNFYHIFTLCNYEAYLELVHTESSLKTSNLSNIVKFDTLFLTNLYLVPMGSVI